MVEVKFCDACGKRIKHYSDSRKLALCAAHYDLCATCYQPILDFVNERIKAPLPECFWKGVENPMGEKE